MNIFENAQFSQTDQDVQALLISKLEKQLLAISAAEGLDQDRETHLRDSLSYIQSILDTLRTPVLVLDGSLRIRTASRAFYQTFAVSPDTAEGNFLYDLEKGAWNISALRERLEEVLPQQNSFEDFEITHDFPNLGRRVMLLNGRKLWHKGHHTTMIVLVIEDITDRRMIEEKALLANEDVQRFAYVAAHDLRTPLGAAAGLANILSTRIHDRLDAREKEILGMMIDNIKRTCTLMEDILSYSVAGVGTKLQDVISLEEPLLIALANLHWDIEASKAVVHYKDLPYMPVDRTQVALLFQNIIGNAIKYKKEDVPVEINITAQKTGTEWTISISDNGIGFEPEHVGKVFEPFTRLQVKDNNGSGIGLATCKRIVERLGGKIWAESAKGQGSVFRFQLPA